MTEPPDPPPHDEDEPPTQPPANAESAGDTAPDPAASADIPAEGDSAEGGEAAASKPPADLEPADSVGEAAEPEPAAGESAVGGDSAGIAAGGDVAGNDAGADSAAETATDGESAAEQPPADEPAEAEHHFENQPENEPDDPGESRVADVDVVPQRGGLPAALRGRRPLLLTIAAVVVVAVVVTLVVVISSGDDRPVPSGTMPTLASQFATPPASTSPQPAEPASLPAYSGAPLWSVRVPGGGDVASAVAVTDQGYVFEAAKDVVGVDRTGKETWRFTPPAPDYFTARVTGTQVFVGYNNPDDDRWPQPQVIIALDAATGAELWRETEASFWEVTTDTIYMSVCRGGQNDHIGDCQLSARDPRTNTTRWRVATYASARPVNVGDGLQAAPTPPYLLVGAYPTGADSYIVSSHDPNTGATRGRGFRGPGGQSWSNVAGERTVVTIEDSDNNPADGCTATLTGFAVSNAAQTWQVTVRTAKDDDGKRCAQQSESYNRGRLAVTDPNGAPSVLNVETGAIEWAAPSKGTAIAATDTTLLVVETEKDSTKLVAYRVGNATPLWRAPYPGSVGGTTVTVTNTTVAVTDNGAGAVGYDLATGKAWSYGERAQHATATSLVACDKGTCRGYGIG